MGIGLLMGFSPFAKAQNLAVVPIMETQRSRAIEIHKNQSILAWQITDTLNLPFFEDFADNEGFPRKEFWTDKQVWVNNGFPMGAPNQNVATFDHLNQFGKPYSSLSKNYSVYADSLTSQPINLQFYKIGNTTYPYKITDNVVLSFFYQSMGIGDQPEPEDSLILFFKGINNQWHKVWGVSGHSRKPFEEIFVSLNKQEFFIPDFQFRWVNYTKATGNLNHWHIDYIRMDKNRFKGFNDIEDVGIVTAGTGLCFDYSNIPYSHYRLNKNESRGNGAFVDVKNLNEAATVQTRYSLKIFNQYQQKLFDQDFAMSSRNILPLADSIERFNTPFFDTLSGPTPSLSYNFIINPQSNDLTPINYGAKKDNNRYTLNHQFQPWYSYDDGSAEGGFGLDYAYLGNIKGQFAMEFNTLSNDTLRGLSMYFTQTKEDVSFRSFRLRIWKKLSPIGGKDIEDELIYEFPVDRPIYRDSTNHFAYFFFDTSIFLPKGTYYVGWLQNMPYILNVGYDNNYRYQGKDQYNPHLFYNLLGSWERADYSIKGTPMIRMMFGERANYSFSTPKIEKPTVKAYPNPAKNFITVESINAVVLSVHILDAAGRLVKIADQQNHIDISLLPSGTYYAKVFTVDGRQNSVKFHKL